jgi:hypothetical protein
MVLVIGVAIHQPISAVEYPEPTERPNTAWDAFDRGACSETLN